ncbi:MAG: hypothetical protein ACYDBB_21500 [Armatimonadota bacterium]
MDAIAVHNKVKYISILFDNYEKEKNLTSISKRIRDLCIEVFETRFGEMKEKADYGKFIDRLPEYLALQNIREKQIDEMVKKYPELLADTDFSTTNIFDSKNRQKCFQRNLHIFSFVADRMIITHENMKNLSLNKICNWSSICAEWNSAHAEYDWMEKDTLKVAFNRSKDKILIREEYFKSKRKIIYDLIVDASINHLKLDYERFTAGRTRDKNACPEYQHPRRSYTNLLKGFRSGCIDMHKLIEQLDFFNTFSKDSIDKIQRYGFLVVKVIAPFKYEDGIVTPQQLAVTGWQGRNEDGIAIEKVFDPPLLYPLTEEGYDILRAHTGVDYRTHDFHGVNSQPSQDETTSVECIGDSYTVDGKDNCDFEYQDLIEAARANTLHRLQSTTAGD